MEADVVLDNGSFRQFIDDSREHLNTVDGDLLAIGRGGANVDAGLVNKVLRTAHSIRNASAFFGLGEVKELAHKVETVLEMIRSKKMTPNDGIANLLLAALNQLREMIDHPDESAGANADELVLSLTGLITSHLPKDQKASLTQTVSFTPQWGTPVMLSTFDYERIVDSGLSLYSVEYDMIHDIERRGLNMLEVFRALMESGEVLDCEVNFKAAGTLDEPIGNRLPMRLIFASHLKPGDVGPLFPYNREKVKLLTKPALTLPLVIFE
jgi:two-component system, chemotaxis family, sensor kinase CheA